MEVEFEMKGRSISSISTMIFQLMKYDISTMIFPLIHDGGIMLSVVTLYLLISCPTPTFINNVTLET